jgi:outer membrane protein
MIIMTTRLESAKSRVFGGPNRRAGFPVEWRALRAAAQAGLALVLAVLVGLGPLSTASAQSAGAAGAGTQSSSGAAQNPPSNPTPNALAPPSTSVAPITSLGLAKHDFTNGPRAFPDIWKPYMPIHIDMPVLTNSPKIDQLIHDGKMELSLEDAIELALQNSIDIEVQRYYPWAADASILKAKAGGFGAGTPGGLLGSSSANLPTFSYDPIFSSLFLTNSNRIPVNNGFISGTGATATTNLAHLFTHSTEFNTAYTQGFDTGTSLNVAWDNTRSSSTSPANFFNPVVQSSLSIGFSQQLLWGFGREVNDRNIRIAKNNRKVADWAFAQQAITTVTNTILAYWELVYARANVQVNEQAITVSRKLYSDNQKQYEAGTMSPLDVVTAESELATDRQNLIVAQTVQLQDEQTLKNLISRDPLAGNLVKVEIITTDQPAQPSTVENPSFEDSIQEAFAKRPELQEQVYNLKNAEIDVKATRNALLPQLTLSGQYSSIGLAGNSTTTGVPTLLADPQLPIVDANGTPIAINGVPVFEAIQNIPITGTAQAGFGTAQSQIFHNRFPEYSGQLNLQLPIRNRSAQSDNVRALLTQRQEVATIQQLKNAAILDVRNTYIALTQDRAQVEAASEARKLEQIAFDDEQKKYKLGASTVYNVILMQRDLITAQGTELRALANLEEAKANYERALGRTLEVNHVTIAEALKGVVERETNIPGTLHGKVVGTEDLFKDSGSR